MCSEKQPYLQGNGNGEDPFKDADIISTYTRAQALADGVLIDVSEMAKEAGFKYPVAVTDNLWAYINPDPMPPGQDMKGRLWDVLTLAVFNARSSKGGDRIEFQVYFLNGEEGECKGQLVDVISVCGPGDNAEPVITIMLPSDD